MPRTAATLAVLALAMILIAAAVWRLYGWEVVAWIWGASAAIGVPAVIYGWWWAHTWPEHAWQDVEVPEPELPRAWWRR